ncbi:MAG: cytochrome c [Ferruginibacter sp.]
MIKKIYLLIGLVTGSCWLVFAQEDTLEESMKRGEEVYAVNCANCHMPAGEGLEAVYPPVANTDYLKDQKLAIDIIVNGQQGEITVNGIKYNTPMDPLNLLSDREVADVLNFISNSWGNKNPMIKPAQVKAGRPGGVKSPGDSIKN